MRPGSGPSATPTEGYALDLTASEAKALVRVVLSDGSFPDRDFMDAINEALDLAYRLAARMLDGGVDGLAEKTVEIIERRRKAGTYGIPSAGASS